MMGELEHGCAYMAEMTSDLETESEFKNEDMLGFENKRKREKDLIERLQPVDKERHFSGGNKSSDKNG